MRSLSSVLLSAVFALTIMAVGAVAPVTPVAAAPLAATTTCIPATTTGATITQCNDSANGETLVGLECTATGTVSDLFDVSINQCNNSTNGGGGLVICSANIISDVVVESTPGPSTSTTPSESGSAQSLPPTDGTNVGPASGVQAQVLIALTILRSPWARSRWRTS